MRSTTTRRSNIFARGRRAFSLAEVMIALTISAMMVSIAIPRVDTTRWRADAIAQIVRTSLQNAGRTAIVRQHDMIVSFDTLKDRVRMVYDVNNDGVIGSTERVTYRGLDVGVLFADPTIRGVNGTTITTAVTGGAIQNNGGLPTITFHRDGSLSSDAEIYVSIAARGPKMHRAIVITQSTGKEEWYRYNPSTTTWQLVGR
jgi:prepilin-type N-terminal cleavage/methylation domain-containing protein